MKKSQKKTASEKRLRSDSRGGQSLSDLGLEPPKIYRDSQKPLYSGNDADYGKKTAAAKGNAQNLTRAEKRQRDNKKRRKRNTFRKVIIWLTVTVAIVAVGTVLSLTVFFHIDTISVSGNELYTEEEILTQCTIDIGENLFLSDTEKAKKTLEQSLPYIYNAEISRKLPYTIQIKITEASPAYSVKNEKKYILLDDNFKVLENDADKAQGILISKAEIDSAVPGTTAEFKDAEVGECLKMLADTVRDNSFTEITSIYSNGVNDNYVVYDKRIEFKLGSCDDLENKIYQGLTACEELNQSNPNAKGVMTVTGGKSLYFTEK